MSGGIGLNRAASDSNVTNQKKIRRLWVETYSIPRNTVIGHNLNNHRCQWSYQRVERGVKGSRLDAQ